MFLGKVNLAKKHEQHKVETLLRRKENLESKLEQLKYHKLLKTISANCKLSLKKNEFTREPTSIYQENPQDPKMSIRSNVYFYENLIKDQFSISDSSDSDEELNQYMNNRTACEHALKRFQEKNPDSSKEPRQISDRRMKMLDADDQVKFIKKLNAIRVEQRSDGKMIDGCQGSEILNILVKSGSTSHDDVDYNKEYKKLSNDLQITENYIHSMQQQSQQIPERPSLFHDSIFAN